jgi:hypothetical protein
LPALTFRNGLGAWNADAPPHRLDGHRGTGGRPIRHLTNHELSDGIVAIDTAALAVGIARIKAERARDAVSVNFLPDLSAAEIHNQ